MNESVLRRLRGADAWRYQLDRMHVAVGRRRIPGLSGGLRLGGEIAMDLVESLRMRRLVPYPGQPHLAALDARVRLPQDPRYRSYWYDPSTHSMVGMHLGIDLIRHGGKYYVIESNLDAAMRPERRQLYGARCDPVFLGLANTARAQGFATIVLFKRTWPPVQLDELKRAGQEVGIEAIAANFAALDTKGQRPVNPTVALPEQLDPLTMYVVFCSLGKTPLIHFMHNKAAMIWWLTEAVAEADPPPSRLAVVPTADSLVVSDPPPGPWPNLVVKLADVDRGRAVAMGRFSTEEEARRSLGLEDGHDSLPRVLRCGLEQKILQALSPKTTRILYQPFIPPEVVGNRARKIRLHALISPLANQFLSAHGTVAGVDLPAQAPRGLVEDNRAYMINYSAGGWFCRLEADVEAELQDVAREYGELAGLAIRKRFVIAPEAGLEPRQADRRAS